MNFLKQLFCDHDHKILMTHSKGEYYPVFLAYYYKRDNLCTWKCRKCGKIATGKLSEWISIPDFVLRKYRIAKPPKVDL